MTEWEGVAETGSVREQQQGKLDVCVLPFAELTGSLRWAGLEAWRVAVSVF